MREKDDTGVGMESLMDKGLGDLKLPDFSRGRVYESEWNVRMKTEAWTCGLQKLAQK